MYFRSAPFLYFRTCTRSATQSMTQRGVKHLEHVSKCLEQQITSSWNDQLCEDWLISQHDQSDSDFKMIMWWILFGVIFRSSNVTGNLHGIGQRISVAMHRVPPRVIVWSPHSRIHSLTHHGLCSVSNVLWSGRKKPSLNLF